MKRYRYKFFKEPRYINDLLLNIACVIDKDTDKPVLFVDVYKDLKKKHNCHLVFSGEFEADHIKGEYYGLIYVDIELFTKAFLINRSLGEVIAMREAGRYLLGHYDNLDEESSDEQERAEMIAADEFAITELSLPKVLDYLNTFFPTDEERKQHAKDFAKKIRESRKVRIEA